MKSEAYTYHISQHRNTNYMPLVSALIINYNKTDLTLRCVESLLNDSYINKKIVVIDNNSYDNLGSRLKRYYPSTHFIRNSENKGYAEGSNIGIQKSLDYGADYVLILNNDVTLKANCISEMINIAENNRDVGVIGPVAYDYDNHAKLVSFKYWFDWNTLKPYSYGDKKYLDQCTDCWWETDYVIGDCILIKKEVLEKVGYFDSRFFLYYEETDLCYRARNAGYKSVIARKATYYRKSGASIGGNSPLFYRYMSRNNLIFFFKHANKKYRRNYVLRFVRMIKWDIFGYHLPKFFKTRDFVNIKNIVAMFQGFGDFLFHRFGRI